MAIAGRDKLSLCLARVPLAYQEIPEATECPTSLDHDIAEHIIDDGPDIAAVCVMNLREKEFGALPKKLLVTGESGTGKTALPVAIAQLSGVPCHKYCGSLIANEYDLSGGVNLIRMFQKAVKTMPCVVAIDGIEVITNKVRYLPNPDSDMHPTLFKLLKACEKLPILFVGMSYSGVTPELHQLMGYDTSHIHLTMPDKQQRESLFRLYIKLHKDNQVKFDNDICPKKLAKDTNGFSQRDIQELIKKTVPKTMRRAMRNNTYDKHAPYTLTMEDLLIEIEKIKDAPWMQGKERPREGCTIS